MARKLRVEFEGAMYHVTVRGVERRNLFREDGDRERLLRKLEEAVERFELDVFLYCWMRNHVHLLVGTPRANLGRFMGWWLTAYTVYFNRKYQRSGHLTQGRYGAKLVEGDEYLLKLSRYIHLNPVRTTAMRTRTVEEKLVLLRAYRWSSYPGYLFARSRQPFVRDEPLLALVGAGRKNPRRAYRRYVETGMGIAPEEWEQLQRASRIAIGSEAFIEQMEAHYADMAERRSGAEDISFRRLGRLADSGRVIATVAEHFDVSVTDLLRRRRRACDRAVAARCMILHCGLTQRAVARQLGMGTGGAVSAQVRKLAETMARDAALRQRVADLEAALERKS